MTHDVGSRGSIPNDGEGDTTMPKSVPLVDGAWCANSRKEFFVLTGPFRGEPFCRVPSDVGERLALAGWSQKKQKAHASRSPILLECLSSPRSSRL